ncbi:alpha/beta fold hydrolase [Chondromyces apiculatus]|uniref:alpha/beta fold hydrolase n=1 Tax=Chondromyces apiculatus TaxID=51 RepID=UPI003520772D
MLAGWLATASAVASGWAAGASGCASATTPVAGPDPAVVAPPAGAPSTTATKAAAPVALDPELTSYEYPFPVQLFSLTSQRQALRMAYEAYQFSFQALVANTRALLESLGVARVSVVGHSMGGMLAARWALDLPAQTERRALVNPIGLEDWKTVVPYRSIDPRSELVSTGAASDPSTS